MESVARGLLPFRDVIGNVAGILTVAQFLSGCFVCNQIRLKQSSEGFSPLSFVLGGALASLQLKYSQMLGLKAMILTTCYSLAICLVYAGWYWLYIPRGKAGNFWKLVLRTITVVSAVLLYAGLEDPVVVRDRFGLIVTVLTLGYIGLPLMKLGVVIERKSCEGLPLPGILASTGASILWLLYGVILHNYFIIIQKVIALGLCTIQLSLFVIYPAPSKAVKAKSK
ncbi:sugar transporter SWEET1-like [Topomyia yanbarensis]|uniref:sugar transporter SWEET1-like n=1 Tax=Topomyia yanbarensis TaxID=2498891 RepID=UPI00273B0006|nr:sugar transporter SWEET1-like [Topomyia yanbarensis]